MRVLHISRGYLKTSLHQLMMSQLEKIGIENQVFVPNCKEDECSISPKPNVCVSKCFNLTDRFIFSLKQFKIVRAAEKNVDVKSFDIIHAYTLFTDGNAAMKLAEKYKKPFVECCFVLETIYNFFSKVNMFCMNFSI